MAVSIDSAIRRGLIAAIFVVAGYATPVLALEFGALTVHSRLDQPLDATVALVNLDAAERASLNAAIAPAAMFERFGIRRTAAVDRMRVETKLSRNGRRAVVQIATQRPINEPFVNFVLQVKTGNGRSLREYTAMLNPGGPATSAPAGPSSDDAAQPAPNGRRTTRQGNDHAVGGVSSHRVQSGETLWSIAARHTPSGASVAQTALAIYRANPSAFDGSPNKLHSDARIKLLSAARVRRVDLGEAQQKLRSASASTANTVSAAGASGDDPRQAAVDPKSDRTADVAPDEAGASARSEPSEMSAEAGEKTATAEPNAPRARLFGRLSLPADTPWPASETIAADSGSIAAAAPDSPTNGPSSAEAAADRPADTAVAASTAADTPSKSKVGGGAAIGSASAASTDGVSESAGGDWLSLRNLLLLIALLALVGLVLHRRRERSYKTIALDPEDTILHDTKAVTPAGSMAPMTTPAPALGENASGGTEPVETAQSGEAEQAAVSTPDMIPPVPRPAPETSAEGQAATPDPAVVAHSTEAGDSLRDHGDDMPPDDDMPEAPARADAPALFHFVDAPKTGHLLFMRPAPASSQHSDALAFENQVLPAGGERRHDCGVVNEPGLAFDVGSISGSGTSKDDPAESAEYRPERHGLEMIDAYEFDLYDPAPDSAEQADDDPSQSVSIRLDLARMYVDMDDAQAARELLAEVRQRGDDDQRRAGEQLLERIAS